MSDTALKEIIQLCLAIEKKASRVFLTLSNNAKKSGLKKVWGKMADDEKKHVFYWEKLLKLAEASQLPNIFDNPNQIREELETVIIKTDEIIKEARDLSDINLSFLLAYRLEFYLLHPGFEALFYLMKNETDNISPDADYREHLNSFITALNEYGVITPELKIISELVNKLWETNRKLAIRLSNIITLRGLIPICISCKNIRDDKGYWNNVESFIKRYIETSLTHGLCPKCMKKFHPKTYKKYQKMINGNRRNF